MESENGIGSGLGWFVFGTVVGVTAAILLAPGSGKATRRKLAKHATRGRKHFFNASQEAIEAVYTYFPEWAQAPAQQRAEKAQRVAAILRERKHEFDAWLVVEAGKTWAEADADVSEAIDFCDYYARQALKLAHPEPLVQ